MVEHFNEKHTPTNGEFLCPLCPKEEFENHEILNKHIKKNHLKSIKKPTKKKKHRKTRMSKNVQCDYCQLFFNQKGNLKKHIDKYHSEEVNQYNDEFLCKAEDLGAKYLVFVSSRSLKMRELSFAQFSNFLRKVCLFFNF